MEEQDYAETQVENDRILQEGYEFDEEYRPANEDFHVFEGGKFRFLIHMVPVVIQSPQVNLKVRK